MGNENSLKWASGQSTSLEVKIAKLCESVEALAPGSKTGVCIASPDRSRLERSIFPNLPQTFQAILRDLPMGPPYIGSCTAAMDGDTMITIHDLNLESRFSAPFIQACLTHGIQSVQSRPVYGHNREPIGTFVMGYAEPGGAERFHGPFMEFAADAVGALLQKELDLRAAASRASDQPNMPSLRATKLN